MAAALAALTGVLLGIGQAGFAAVVVVGVLLVCAQMMAPRSLFVMGILLSVFPALRGVPVSVVVGGANVYFSEVLLSAGFILALLTLGRPPGRELGRPFIVFTSVVLLGVLVGLVYGVTPTLLIADVRGPVYVLFTYAGTVLLLRNQDRRPVVLVLASILWFTAFLVAAESLLGLHLLAGRVEELTRVEAGAGGNGVDAIRFLLAPTNLALLVVCVGMVFLLRGAARPWRARFISLLLLPSLVLVFFSFSRRGVLAVAVTIVLVFTFSSLSTALFRGIAVGFVAFALVLAGNALPIASNSYFGKQVHAFSARVLTGLSDNSRAKDPGIAWRDTEDRFAFKALAGSPIIGHGFGAQYRPSVAGEPFSSTNREYGRAYVHNFYLWLLVKTGLVGFLAFGLFVLSPVVRAFRSYRSRPGSPSMVTFAIAAALVGVGATNIVAPSFNEIATAVLLGCTLGLLQMSASDQLIERAEADQSDRSSILRLPS